MLPESVDSLSQGTLLFWKKSSIADTKSTVLSCDWSSEFLHPLYCFLSPFLLVCVYGVCTCLCRCVHVGGTCECGGSRWTLISSLIKSHLEFLRQGSSLSLELVSSGRVAGQGAPGSTCHPLPTPTVLGLQIVLWQLAFPMTSEAPHAQ